MPRLRSPQLEPDRDSWTASRLVSSRKASKTNPNQMASWNRFVFNRLKLINAPQFFFVLGTHSSVLSLCSPLRYDSLCCAFFKFVTRFCFVSYCFVLYNIYLNIYFCVLCVHFISPKTSQFPCASLNSPCLSPSPLPLALLLLPGGITIVNFRAEVEFN